MENEDDAQEMEETQSVTRLLCIEYPGAVLNRYGTGTGTDNDT
jgi:hypothetical protein